MSLSISRSIQPKGSPFAAFFLLVSLFASVFPVAAQTATSPLIPDQISSLPSAAAVADDPGFRVEKVRVTGGSEIVTIFARSVRPDGDIQGPESEIPLVSILRDTLGDEKPENDRLRYVWMLTYTRPSLSQKISAFIPFLYGRTTNKKSVGSDPPPALLDLQPADRDVWGRVFWLVFKRLVLNNFGLGVRAPAMQYRQNASDYRRSAVAAAMAVLSLYEETEGKKVLSDTELQDIQARLSLSDKMFGWHMQSENLGRVYEKERTGDRDFRGHNWELLRQYSEAQGLYFDPMELPDGTARHAIVWTSAADIAANKGRKFESRFLNIKNPWTDDRLANWKGYSQETWFDADGRVVEPNTPNATPKTMIPLAIYGLDHPKIPILLVDFRDNANPKFREMSRRILNDVTTNILAVSPFGNVAYFFGKFIYDFVTGRRGMDLNQTSRLRAYSQLKLLLKLDSSLDPEFQRDIEKRIESATLNPLENDTDVEVKLARKQYDNLMAYAARPDGLPARIARDRREEMTRVNHSVKERTLFAVAHVFSLGIYTHREDDTPELFAKMDLRRQLDYHERFLNETAASSAQPAIDGNEALINRSLAFVAENGYSARSKTTRALAKIFQVSSDPETRALCLSGLYRINNSSAKKELLAIYRNPTVPDRMRDICAHYLKLALKEGQQISARDAVTIAGISAN